MRVAERAIAKNCRLIEKKIILHYEEIYKIMYIWEDSLMNKVKTGKQLPKREVVTGLQ